MKAKRFADCRGAGNYGYGSGWTGPGPVLFSFGRVVDLTIPIVSMPPIPASPLMSRTLDWKR